MISKKEVLLQDAAFLQSSIDALTAQIAVLDQYGRIVMVNEAWKSFAHEHDLDDPGVGADYLRVAESAQGEFAEQGHAAGRGVRKVLSGRQSSFRMEYPCQTAKGTHWFQMRVTSFRFSDAVWAVVAHETVTELREAQERILELEHQCAQRQRMESLGLMASGVAHDLNNLLTPLVGYPKLIGRGLDGADPLQSTVRSMEQAAARAQATVDDLMTMVRAGQTQRQPLRLHSVVASYLDSGAHAACEEEFPKVRFLPVNDSKWAIQGAESILFTMIMNLCRNAAEATKRGTVRIISKDVVHAEPYEAYETIPAGSYVMLAVEDSGEGISQDAIGHLFEPFYTKKILNRTAGTGLGMYIVWSAVKGHDGYVDVGSDRKDGTSIRVYIPRTLEEP